MSECGLFWVDGTLFWVGGSNWECMGHFFGWVGVSGAGEVLFWVGGSGWENILAGWGWVVMSPGEWGWMGVCGCGCTVSYCPL